MKLLLNNCTDLNLLLYRSQRFRLTKPSEFVWVSVTKEFYCKNSIFKHHNKIPHELFLSQNPKAHSKPQSNKKIPMFQRKLKTFKTSSKTLLKYFMVNDIKVFCVN